MTTTWSLVALALLVGTGFGYLLGRSSSRASRREPTAAGSSSRSGLFGPLPMGIAAGALCALIVGGLWIWNADVNPVLSGSTEPVEPAGPSMPLPRQEGSGGSLEERDRYVLANPDDLAARREMALILLSEERFMDAMGQADQILERQPDDPTAFYVQGVVRLTMGQRGRGRELLERAIELDPQHLHSLIALGRLHLQEGRSDQAIAAWRTALEAAGGRHAGIEKMLAEAGASSDSAGGL